MFVVLINVVMIIILVVLHFVDAIATMYLVYNNHAIEINPLMAACLAAGPMVFIFVKAFLVFLGTLFSWALREEKYLIPLLLFLILVYSFVVLKQFEIFCHVNV